MSFLLSWWSGTEPVVEKQFSTRASTYFWYGPRWARTRTPFFSLALPQFWTFFTKISIFFSFLYGICTFFPLFSFFWKNAIFLLGKKNKKKGPFLDCRIGKVGCARTFYARFERKDIYAKAKKTIWKTVQTGFRLFKATLLSGESL